MFCKDSKYWEKNWSIFKTICIVFMNEGKVFKFKDKSKLGSRFNREQILKS